MNTSTTLTTRHGDNVSRSVVMETSLDRWQEFVASNPDSTTFHHRKWIELLAAQYKSRYLVLSLVENDRLLCGIPFLETRTALGGRKLISLPFTDCQRVLRTGDDALRCLCDCLRTAYFASYREVTLRSDEQLPVGLHVAPHVRHLLNTARPWEDVACGFKPDVRRLCRRGERLGLRFQRRTDPEAMEIFYRLHVATRRKLGVPVQPAPFFRLLQAYIIDSGLGYVGLVEQAGRPIAASVFLEYQRTLIYKYSASDPAALSCGPNEVMLYHAVQAACLDGYGVFDFGVTDRDQHGLCRFKRKFGTEETDVWHVYLAGRPPRQTGRSTLLALAAPVIRRSPTLVCRALGNAFYRYSQ